MKQNNVIPQGNGQGITAEWVWNYFRAVDTLDPEQVVQHYLDDGSFRFANQPPAKGHAAIRSLLANFYQQIQSMEHVNTGLWLGNNTAVFEAEASFVRKDGTTFLLPAVSVIRRRDHLIEDFRFVMDASPMMRT